MDGQDREAHTPQPKPQLQDPRACPNGSKQRGGSTHSDKHGPRTCPNGSKQGDGSTHSDKHAGLDVAPPYGFHAETLREPKGSPARPSCRARPVDSL